MILFCFIAIISPIFIRLASLSAMPRITDRLDRLTAIRILLRRIYPSNPARCGSLFRIRRNGGLVCCLVMSCRQANGWSMQFRDPLKLIIILFTAYPSLKTDLDQLLAIGLINFRYALHIFYIGLIVPFGSPRSTSYLLRILSET